MRARHVIAVAIVLVLGLGAKQFFSPPKQAEANINAVPSAGLNVLEIHRETDMKNLAAQKVRDMTFVFDAE